MWPWLTGIENLHLSPVSAVVQLHPQLHHLDAVDELPKARGGKARKEGMEDDRGEPEARAIDVKIKAAEDNEAAMVAGNLDLLKKMQEEKWGKYEWVDAEVRSSLVFSALAPLTVIFVQTEESWQVYESYMMHQELEELPQLQSAINSEDYLDKMSAPRIDPAHPEMTGWAMKQNRKKQGGKESSRENAEGSS